MKKYLKKTYKRKTYKSKNIKRKTYKKRNFIKGGENKECSICLKALDTSSENITLEKCRHTFHKECLKPWVVAEKRTCPNCREGIITSDEVNTIKNSLTGKRPSSEISYERY